MKKYHDMILYGPLATLSQEGTLETQLRVCKLPGAYYEWHDDMTH